MNRHLTIPLTLTLAALISSGTYAAPILELQQGDHICYLGNTLADRMQHHAWLETFLHTRYPKRELVVRNLGFSGDTLKERPRSKDFGTPDSHLSHSKADVIFAFFGYNESFAGEAGLDQFKQDLAQFIDHTTGQHYNDKSPPRLIIFSPIAHEDLGSPHLPSGAENNRRLEIYTRAMKAVSGEKNIPFVDIFTPTLQLYDETEQPLTINGIHLTKTGNRLLAVLIDTALFGEAPGLDAKQTKKLREAILDKNLYWHNRYRATDGYSTFGGRAWLKFVDDQTNYVVLQRELEMLDVMSANRDKRIWETARGKEFTVDDSNAPEAIPVKTNLPGPHGILSGEDAIDKMTLAKGMQINLFASEEQFPELINPVQSSVDTDGRLWVAAWPTYPHWNPRKEMNDKLLIFPDENRDGKADRCIVFADNLHNPTGFEFWGGGVLLALAPDLIFLKDHDGDDRVDEMTRVLHGLDSADTHHAANSLVIGPTGWLYFQRGVFHFSNIETPWGPTSRDSRSAVYRFHPRTYTFEHYFDVGVNPHGDTHDRWGNHFVTDGTGGNGYYVGFPERSTPKQLFQQKYRPVAAIDILSSEHFPAAMQGNLLICNVIGFQGIAQYRFVEHGAGFHAEETEVLLSSTDPNFRPSDLDIGGDGALYFLDWHNPLIGHMQHNLRDPSRDERHGRIYRITAQGRPLTKEVQLAGKPITELLEHLASPTLGVRYRTRLELSGRHSADVVAQAAELAAKLNSTDETHAQHLVELLWVHQHHRHVNKTLLMRVLESSHPEARAVGVRALRDWIQHVPEAAALLVTLAGDKSPRVRAEAVVASKELPGAEKARVIFEAARWPLDEQIEFNIQEIEKSLDARVYLARLMKSSRAEFEKLIRESKSERIRRTAFAAWILSEGSSGAAFRFSIDHGVFPDLIGCAPLIESNEVRTDMYNEIRTLMFDSEKKVEQAGVHVSFYHPNPPSARRENFESRPPNAAGVVSSIRIEVPQLQKRDAFALRFVGELLVENPGKYTFYSNSDDGSMVYINDEIVVDNDGTHGSREKSGKVDLDVGRHDIEVTFFDQTGSERLEVTWAGPGFAKQPIPTTNLRVDPLKEIIPWAIDTLHQFGGPKKAFEDFATLIRANRFIPSAVRGMLQIPKEAWIADEEELFQTALNLVHYLNELTPKKRSSQEAIEGTELLDRFPEELRRRVSEKVKWKVPFVRIGTVPHRMIYDKEQLVVEAGQEVDFVFQNTDQMPHNFVITKPGSLREVGQAAEATAQAADAIARHYVPKTTKILVASTLLQPGQSEVIHFQTPTTPGIYPYVCTYPGHWTRMNGALYVVEDLEAYLADPKAYMMAHPLELEDKLLARRNTEWTFDALAPAVKTMHHGRFFEVGQAVFKAASCIACHRMNGEGQEIGPDLAKLADERLHGDQLLRSLVEPSKEIEDKYRSEVFVLTTGDAITGMVVEETPAALKVAVDPQGKTPPVSVKKADIQVREPSPKSIMPEGILNKLTHEEILDLIAYLMARGNKKHDLFGGGNQHKH